MTRIALRLSLSLACVALFGCAQATQIVVVVDSDLDLTRVDVEVSSTRSPPTRATADFSVASTPPLPLTLTLYPRAGADPEVFVTVTGQTAGSTIERRARTRFVSGSSRMLRILLAARCIDVHCTGDQTCDESGCRAIEIPGGDLPAWIETPPHIDGPACTASPEVCNGADDDCDMAVDEDFVLATDAENCGGCGHTCSGACRSGLCDGEGAAHVATGGAHTCVARESGDLSCWGWNLEGQIGEIGRTISSAPADVMGIASPVSVAGGGLHTCVTDMAGRVQCFGDGTTGALGRGDTADDAVPSPVLGTATYQAIELGPGYSCAITTADDLVCWGANDRGQLGIGSTTDTQAPGPTTLGGVADVSLGYRHACAVLTDHTLWCWGDDAAGQIGEVTMAATMPVQMAGVTDAAQVACGRDFTCFVRMDGTVACLGANALGQLGDGTTSSSTTPSAVIGVSDVTSISAASGGTHVCVVRGAGTVNCWGGNASGQRGDGTTNGGSMPVLVLDLSDIEEVAAGGLADDGSGHTCARDGEGRVWCWGDAGLGQLGTGDTLQRSRPALVLGLSE